MNESITMSYVFFLNIFQGNSTDHSGCFNFLLFLFNRETRVPKVFQHQLNAYSMIKL